MLPHCICSTAAMAPSHTAVKLSARHSSHSRRVSSASGLDVVVPPALLTQMSR